MIDLFGSDAFRVLVVGHVLGGGGSVEVGEGEMVKDGEESSVFV